MAGYPILIIPCVFLLILDKRIADTKDTVIIHDVSNIVKNYLKTGAIATQAENALVSFISENMATGEDVISMYYYETDMDPDLLLHLHHVLYMFDQMKPKFPKFKPKVMFSIRETRGLLQGGTNWSEHVKKYYGSILTFFASRSYIVEGLSVYDVGLEKSCHSTGNQPTSSKPSNSTSIISELQHYLDNIICFGKRDCSLELGYEIPLSDFKCEYHLSNKQGADFVVLNIPLKRSDPKFVESYGLFKANFENEKISNAKTELTNKVVYVKVSLATLERKEIKMSGGLTPYPGLDLKILNNHEKLLGIAKVGLEKRDKITARRYENLMTKYVCEWTRNGNQSKKIIIQYVHRYPYFNDRELFESSKKKGWVIPYLSNLPEKQLTVGLKGSDDIFLEDVGLAGFPAVMVNGRSWDMITARNKNHVSTCQNDCRPMEVLYMINDAEHLEEIRVDPQRLRGIGNLHLNSIVYFENFFDLSTDYWDQVIKTLSSHNITASQHACQIWTDVFDDFGDYRKVNNVNIRNAMYLRGTYGSRCKPSINVSKTVVWMQPLLFDKLENQFWREALFVQDFMSKLDAFVIAREILLGEFPNISITLQFKAYYEGNLSKIGSGAQLYCTRYAEKISQYYEAILTWAQIHDFPVILEPADDAQFRYDNPLAWKQLEVSSSSGLQEKMKTHPLFIRQSYNSSKMFGSSWTNDMYACIPKATNDSISRGIPFFDNEHSGVTLNLRSQQDNVTLNPKQVQTIFFSALGKFSNVEVIMTQKQDFTILNDFISLAADMDKNTIKNQLGNKAVYLRLPKLCSDSFDDYAQTVNHLVSRFKEYGLVKVNVHVNQIECLDNVASSSSSSGTDIGMEVANCTQLVESMAFPIWKSTRYRELSYLVCLTEAVLLVDNREEEKMQDFLDSLFYLKQLLQKSYPNLKQIYFRLQSKPNLPEQSTNFLMFLSDLNHYSKGYKINFFMSGQGFVNEINSQMDPNFRKMSNTGFNATTVSSTQVMDTEFFSSNSTSTTASSIVKSSESATQVNPFNVFETETQPTNVTEYTTPGPTTTETFFTNNTFEKPNDHDTTYNKTANTPGNEIDSDNNMYIYILSVTLIFIMVVVAKILLTKLKWNQFKRGLTCTQISDVIDPNNYDAPNTEADMTHLPYEISRNDIDINLENILGMGQFGVVYGAKLVRRNGEKVAVKMLHDGSPHSALNGMKKEMKLLCGVGEHDNVVRFIGCYTAELHQGILWLVTEICDGGSLLAFLRSKKSGGLTEEFGITDLMRLSCEIASGMEYISGKKIIHGDLATRNVLLAGDGTCKIGDFGLSRQLYDYAEYFKTSQDPLPWRWMAYESLGENEFSTKSDVWMYGVTLWEIFSLGSIPYPGLRWSINFVGDLEGGLRPSIPHHATGEIYQLMEKCWKLDKNERPTFTHLVEEHRNFERQKYYTVLGFSEEP